MRPDELLQHLQLPFQQDGAQQSSCRPQIILSMLTFEKSFERRTVKIYSAKLLFFEGHVGFLFSGVVCGTMTTLYTSTMLEVLLVTMAAVSL